MLAYPDSGRMTMLPGFSFQVILEGVPLAFQKVGSIEDSIDIQHIQEGGVNDRVHSLRGPVGSVKTLVMEKGIPVGNLGMELFHEILASQLFRPGNRYAFAVILVCNRKKSRIARAYLATNLVLKSWSLSELDAMNSGYLVERLEFTYEHIDKHALQEAALLASGAVQAMS